MDLELLEQLGLEQVPLVLEPTRQDLDLPPDLEQVLLEGARLGLPQLETKEENIKSSSFSTQFLPVTVIRFQKPLLILVGIYYCKRV